MSDRRLICVQLATCTHLELERSVDDEEEEEEEETLVLRSVSAANELTRR